jgi:outer membrane protein
MKSVIFHSLIVMIGWSLASNATSMTLEDSLAIAYHNSPLLEARRAELRAIDEGMAQAVSGWRPNLAGEASYEERHQDAGIGGANSPVNPDVQFNPFRWGFTLDQPIYRGGQTVAEMRQAKSQVYEGRANLHSAEQDVLLNTATAYFDVRQDQVVQDLNRNNVQVLRQQLAASEDRFEVGEITRTDVAQSKAALSAALSNLTISEARLSGSRARYQRHVGQLPSQLEAGTGLPALPANVDDAISIAIARNPILVAARHSEEAARHSLRRTVGNMLPLVSVQGEYSRIKEPSQFRTYNRDRIVMARVSIPLYQAGGASSRVREARQIHNQRRIETLRIDREVRKRSKDQWADFLAVKSNIISRKEQVRANEIAHEGVRQEALVGSRTTLDVLDEEQRLLDSRVALENARRDEHVAAYQILSLIGELSPQKLDLDVESYDPAINYHQVRYRWIGLGQSANDKPLPNVDTSPVITSGEQPEASENSAMPAEGAALKDNTDSKPTAVPNSQGASLTRSPGEQFQSMAATSGFESSNYAGAKKYLVQLAAYRSIQGADRGWEKLTKRHPDILGDHSSNVIGVMLNGDQQYYRLRVGPKSDKEASQQLCQSLKDQGQNCWIVRH